MLVTGLLYRLRSTGRSPQTRRTGPVFDQSAKDPQPARRGEFFLRPETPAHRRYEALRAYLAEGLPAAEAAARSGYTPASLLSAVRDFRAGAREFFTAARPGPKTAPGKDAARRRASSARRMAARSSALIATVTGRW